LEAVSLVVSENEFHDAYHPIRLIGIRKGGKGYLIVFNTLLFFDYAMNGG